MDTTPVYTDFSGLAELKAKAKASAPEAVSKVAKQFESLLMGQMLKTMRQASLGEGILDNDQSRFYLEMFDQQISLHLAEHGGMGLAAAIERQLGGGPPVATEIPKEITHYSRVSLQPPQFSGPAQLSQKKAAAPDIAAGTSGSGVDTPNTLNDDPADWNKEDFIQQLWPWALEAASMIGLEPQALLAQAALETGWGRHIIRRVDGSPSHNLFGIKASNGWRGARVNVGSLEYEQGVAVKRQSAFRAYDSFRESFHDYVDFLQSNPRYNEALGASYNSRRYFTSLQKAGYATDPDYANKIDAVLNGKDMQHALTTLKGSSGKPL